MNTTDPKIDVSRRQFLKRSSVLMAGAAAAPYVLNTQGAPAFPIRVGLIGCGGRGSGAVRDCHKSSKDVTIVAVSDVFEDRAKGCAESLNKEGHDVKPDRVFSGFDGYKKVLAIEDINYVILATPPGFRPIHFPAAIAAGKNVFMEKPVATDGPGLQAMYKAGEEAAKKGLGVVAGTQRRHQKSYLDTIKRIQDGAIGEVLVLRGYWNQGLIWNNPWDDKKSDMENNLRNWYHYVWLCGDHIVEQHVHNLDVCNWIMHNEHPIKAYGRGARQVLKGRGHIYDHFSVEYEYRNGVRMFSQCRQIGNCTDNVSESVVGTRGSSNPGGSIRIPGMDEWRSAGGGVNPYVQEHADLITSIRAGAPLNETKQVTDSTLTAIMGRESAYSGKVVDFESVLAMNSIMPERFDMNMSLPAPAPAVPGVYKFD
jgi:myo-inositol 2-dehydrogenase/D-chiro-inositol 1-dehydrogenase